jgi:parallel beta-helix repeat protein
VRWIGPFVLAGLILGGAIPFCRGAAELELYGTFEAMGVIVTVAAGDDPEQDAAASLEYRPSGTALFRPGWPLSRVSPTRFVGSLFYLQPGTGYDVRVTFSDTTGGTLNGVVVSASQTTRVEITLPLPAHSYFVSPGGTGSTCSAGQPCALAQALSQAQPGEEIVLLPGVYPLGELTPPRSGAAGAPIVIRAEAAGTAILDGADPGAFAWTAMGGGVYRTTVNSADPHLVLADGQRLFPYASLAALQSLQWGQPGGCYADGTSLYVRLPGDANPASAQMIISRFNQAFTVEQDWLCFIDLVFRHYGCGSYAKAIYLNNANDNLIRGCTFASNDLGVGLKRDSHRNVIEDCEFYDSIFSWSWDAVKTTGGLEDGGVAFYDPMTGRGTVIRRNHFHDDFDGFGACPESTAGLTNETDIYDNLIDHMGDDGMETDGQCSNVRIWGNTFHDVLMGISLAPVYTGPVYVIRNLIYRTGAGNNSYTGSPFKFNSGYGTSGPMFLLHNTADAALPGNNGLYIKAPGTWTGIVARNNIWAGTAFALENYNTTQPVDLDYDDLWNDHLDDLVRWNSTRYPELSDFQQAVGQELNGLSVPPGFLDAAGGEYTLHPASALIDQAVPLPGINDDFIGDGPDLGAFEYPARPGDIDGDGDVDSADALRLADYLAGNPAPLPWGVASADLDGDGSVTVVDLVTLLLRL